MHLMPKEAYSYWPSPENCLLETKDFVERLIFSRQEYKDWEISGIMQLDKLLKHALYAQNLEKSDKLRFLYGSGWKLSQTVKAIEENHKWKQDWPSYKLIYPLIVQILNSGGVYINGKDHRYRPIVILTPSLLTDFPQHLLMATSYFLMEYIKENMLIPGQVENFTLIIDLQNFEIKDYCRAYIQELLLHYPCRLAKAFIFNSARQMAKLSKLFSLNTLQKLTIVEGKSPLMSICNPSQVEIKFGGTAENLSSFWPPVAISNAYRAECDPPGGLISAYSSYDEYFLLNPKMNSELSILKISQFEDKESFISNSELKDEFWQKLDVVSGSFSFLHTDVCKAHDSEPEFLRVPEQRGGKSEDMTRTSSQAPVKKISIEQELVEPSCCIDSNCNIL